MRQRTQHAAVLPPAVPYPMIVAILGPAWSSGTINAVAVEQELAGRLVLMPHVRPSEDLPDAAEWNERHQARLHELALRRIDAADEVIVVGPDKHLGDAIHEQIAYAISLHKPVRRRVS